MERLDKVNPGDSLATHNAAVVLIDMQNDVVHNASPPIRHLIAESGVVEACVRAISDARTVGIPIIFVRVLRRPAGRDAVVNSTDSVARAAQGKIQSTPTCVEGTPGAALVDALQFNENDYLVSKRRRGAFCATELNWLLQYLGLRRLLIGGVATNLGVESTVREGYDLGYDVLVMSDCCCGFNKEDHDWAINRIFPNMARVMTAAQALTFLQTAPADEFRRQ